MESPGRPVQYLGGLSIQKQQAMHTKESKDFLAREAHGGALVAYFGPKQDN